MIYLCVYKFIGTTSGSPTMCAIFDVRVLSTVLRIAGRACDGATPAHSRKLTSKVFFNKVFVSVKRNVAVGDQCHDEKNAKHCCCLSLVRVASSKESVQSSTQVSKKHSVCPKQFCACHRCVRFRRHAGTCALKTLLALELWM